MKIDSFDGEHRFLSNFFRSPISMRGTTFQTVEHAYQAAKTLDPEQRAMIRLAPSPGKAKRLGQKVTMRPDWEEKKLGIMHALVALKFLQNPELQEKLLATGDAELVEGNYWGDRFWGTVDGVGENHLGRILMEVREDIRTGRGKWAGSA